MILRRLGNKKRIAHKIIAHFPPHKIYISPFFGAGGLFFQKPKSPYNIVNDLDSDVFNLFQVVMNQKEELKKALYLMPIHNDLLEYWKTNKEDEPVRKALRFLFLSNLTYLGKQDTLRFSPVNDKKIITDLIEPTVEFLQDVRFMNFDFRDMFKKISLNDINKSKTLIYCDPPYLDQISTYDIPKWIEADSLDLFDCLEATGCKFAMSEFNNPFILEQAEKRGLNVHIIGDRQNLKNRRTEILITNYQKRQLTFKL